MGFNWAVKALNNLQNARCNDKNKTILQSISEAAVLLLIRTIFHESMLVTNDNDLDVNRVRRKWRCDGRFVLGI